MNCALVETLGFVRLSDDYCVYKQPGRHVYIVLWVDDCLLAYDQTLPDTVNNVVVKLQDHLGGKITVAKLQDFLGVRVRRSQHLVKLDLEQYLDQLLIKAGMANCKPAPTPATAGFVWTKKDCPTDDSGRSKEARWFRSILASCIFLVMWIRVDGVFAVSKLSKFMQNPGSKHVAALKRLLRYFQGTRSRCLAYDFRQPPLRSDVYGYFDASHADDVDTRRSTMAYVFFFYGCLISWRSKLHSFVTLSTNHSEYVAASIAAREAKWLSKIFRSLDMPKTVSPILLFSDSQGAIAMNYNPVRHSANKHVDIADHYAREQVQRGLISISYVRTEDMLADALTKALTREKFNYLVSQFMDEGTLSSSD